MMNVIALSEIKTAPENALYDADRGEYRFIVDIDQCHVPVLVRPSGTHNDTLLITYNGAIQRSKAPDGVVFQRSSWLEDFESSVLQIADPTMVKHERLQIGWGQYSKDRWAIENLVTVTNVLRNRFNLAGSENTLHFGSSAGGFQAISCATFDRGSKALVNNPQLDWSRYNERFVNALLRDVFDGLGLEDIRGAQPWRVSVIDLFESRGYMPETEVMLNTASSGDLEQQLKPAIERMANLDTLGKVPSFRFDLYHDVDMGHNPLGRLYTVEKINSKLSSIRPSV